MTLDDALALARREHLVLQPRRRSHIGIWPENADAALTVRRVVYRHRRQVLRMLREADVKVCCSPSWHRSHWRYAGQQRYVCQACEVLDEQVRQLELWRA